MNIKIVKNLLKSRGIRPLKRLGQNFLINKKILEKIIRTSNLSKNDIILEVGSGVGNLTVEIAKRTKKVIQGPRI